MQVVEAIHVNLPNPVLAQVELPELPQLLKVLNFARECDVAAMCELLLKHGASESADDHGRWLLRQYSDANDQAYLRNFFRDDREG